MSSKGMSRRELLARGSLAVAGLAVGRSAAAQMMGGGGRMGGGGGSTVLDPPPGGALQALPPAVGEVVDDPMLGRFTRYALEARLAPVTIAGATASAWVYADRNGALQRSFVAPVLRASPGGRIRLELRNGLPGQASTNLLGHARYPTNVHVHGLHVSPGRDAMTCNPADDVHRTILPGESLVFDYDFEKQRPGTLALYHPHLHGTVAEQMWSGLAGLVDVSDGDVHALDGYETSLLALKDVTISGGAPAPYTMLSDYMHGKEGGAVMVNGQVNPVLTVRPGEVRRLRIANVSNARFYRLALQGHSLRLVGADGGLLPAPSLPQAELLVSPGERVDVLVEVSRTAGPYKLLALPYARRGSMASAQVTLLTMEVTGAAAAQALPTAVDGAASPRVRDDDPGLRRARFTLGMAHGRGYVNGVTFVDGEHAFQHHSEVGTEEIWEIVNASGMDHPWHQHVNDAQVLSISGGDAAIARYASLYTGVPAWKDTVIVPKWGSVTLRIPVKDFGGMTMFHCHILEHEDIGMMGMWHLMPMGAGGCMAT
jgi:FtsP/CotA-like multicopper oxidase with cupredoxin domain